MKKIFSFALVCVLALAANAQIVSSSSRSIKTADAVYPNYNRIYVGYHPTTWEMDDVIGTDLDAAGYALGWTGGYSITKKAPLYLEAGLNLKYNSKSKNLGSYDGEAEFKALCLSVPVSISYKYDIPNVDGLSIAPYAGLHLNGNIIGEMKYKGYYSSEKLNVFDDDDVDDPANRIQFGYQIGVGVNYKALYLGVGYSSEFTEYMEDVNTGGMTLNLGLNF